MRTPTRQSGATGAFTLVELLVVISIIALLVTILMPSLVRARQLARRSVCLLNLRRLAVAAWLYTADNDDKLPPHRLPFHPDRTVYVNEYGRKKPRWPWFLHQGAGPVIDPSTPDFQNALEMTNDYFLCPSLKDKYARDIRNGAYGYNHAYLGSGRPKPGTGANKYVPMNFPVLLDGISHASSTVAFADSRGAVDGPDMAVRQHAYTLDAPRLARSLGFTQFGPKNNIDPRVPAKWCHSPAHERHLGLANAAFVDGHADSMTLRQLGYQLDSDGMVIRDAGSNRLWTGTGEDEP